MDRRLGSMESLFSTDCCDGLRIDFMEDRRFELDSEVDGVLDSVSAGLNERLRFGERNELGESDGMGEG